MSARFHDMAVRINGEEVRERVDARKTLVDFLREDVALTGSHVGCEHGVCGACTVRVDGVVVRGCLMLAIQCDGAQVETIEGVADSGEIADLQRAFIERNALQCGFCTPGHAVDGTGTAGKRRGSEPRGDPRASLRQLLPLHGLSGHRRCRRIRCPDACGTSDRSSQRRFHGARLRCRHLARAASAHRTSAQRHPRHREQPCSSIKPRP